MYAPVALGVPNCLWKRAGSDTSAEGRSGYTVKNLRVQPKRCVFFARVAAARGHLLLLIGTSGRDRRRRRNLVPPPRARPSASRRRSFPAPVRRLRRRARSCRTPAGARRPFPAPTTPARRCWSSSRRPKNAQLRRLHELHPVLRRRRSAKTLGSSRRL